MSAYPFVDDEALGHDKPLVETNQKVIVRPSVEEAVAFVLKNSTGLDITSEHGARTPIRFVRMLEELTSGGDYEFTTFPAESDEMVVVKNIPFVSLCEHHIIPFIGVTHVGYVPFERIAGLSKFARLVRAEARRLQVQERLTTDIANRIVSHLHPQGVAVVVEAEHMCMTIRGVQTPGTKTVTAAMRGVFADHEKTAKAEFFEHIGRS